MVDDIESYWDGTRFYKPEPTIQAEELANNTKLRVRTKEELLAMSAEDRAKLSMVDVQPNSSSVAIQESCTNCTDCNSCTDCNGCTDCIDCTYCNYCNRCWQCIDCNYCTDCSICIGCIGCTDCRGILNGRYFRWVAWGIHLTQEEYESL